MTQSPKRHAPATYQLRVDGYLDHHWSSWFGDLTLTHEDDGTTSLTGEVADQAELHGWLTKIRDLGVTLISVEVVATEPGLRSRICGRVAEERADEGTMNPRQNGFATGDGGAKPPTRDEALCPQVATGSGAASTTERAP
jgi:hypothetical protein